MATSPDQRSSMHRISPNNPARRRLFADDDTTDQARIDNFANVLQETSARDKVEKMHKWNFDFENEVPLEGTYEWYRCDDDSASDWVGTKNDTKIDEDGNANGEHSFLPMKMENEVTPKMNKEGDSAPLHKKRRKDDSNGTCSDKGVRRRISFD